MNTIHQGWNTPPRVGRPTEPRLAPRTCQVCKKPFVPRHDTDTICQRSRCAGFHIESERKESSE